MRKLNRDQKKKFAGSKPNPKNLRIKLSGILVILALPALTAFFVGSLASNYLFQKNDKKSQCQKSNLSGLILVKGEEVKKNGNVTANKVDCYYFDAESGQSLILTSDIEMTLVTPDNQTTSLNNGSLKYVVEKTGQHILSLNNNSRNDKTYSLTIQIQSDETERLTQNTDIERQSELSDDKIAHSEYTNAGKSWAELQYNIVNQPPFNPDPNLQSLVDQLVNSTQQQGLPTDKLSISLVDLNSSPCCDYAQINDQEARFPASVTKLFWMTALYGQYESNSLPQNTISETEIQKMISDSDNEPASRIVDALTRATSEPTLTENEFQIWEQKRFWLNRYFEDSLYLNINITQKNFPVPSLELFEPEGTELQIRGNQKNPIRNFLTTYSVSRLLFEIYNEQAVSPYYSQRMRAHLKRSLRAEDWKSKPFNSITGFLGEPLPPETQFYSKAGWTSGNRNDAAIIESLDGSERYILVVFGDSSAYTDDEKFFPDISQQVYNFFSKR